MVVSRWPVIGRSSCAEHPGVFAAAALRRVHDQRAPAQGHAGEAAGDESYVFTVENVGTKIDVAGLRFAIEKARSARQAERRLRDVVAGLGLDSATEVFTLLGSALRTDQHAVAAGFAHGFYDQFVEVIEHIILLRAVSKHVGRNISKNRIFTQVVADDRGNVGIDGFVIGDAGANGIGQAHIAGAVGVEQAGDAEAGIALKAERVEEVVVNAAGDDVDAAKASGGAHVDDVVVDEQIAAFDELDAHLLREKCVLEIRG